MCVLHHNPVLSARCRAELTPGRGVSKHTLSVWPRSPTGAAGPWISALHNRRAERSRGPLAGRRAIFFYCGSGHFLHTLNKQIRYCGTCGVRRCRLLDRLWCFSVAVPVGQCLAWSVHFRVFSFRYALGYVLLLYHGQAFRFLGCIVDCCVWRVRPGLLTSCALSFGGRRSACIASIMARLNICSVGERNKSTFWAMRQRRQLPCRASGHVASLMAGTRGRTAAVDWRAVVHALSAIAAGVLLSDLLIYCVCTVFCAGVVQHGAGAPWTETRWQGVLQATLP